MTPSGCVVVLQTLSRLSCAYKKENQTKMVVCDLGNPMKGGTKVSDRGRAVDHSSARVSGFQELMRHVCELLLDQFCTD